MELLSSPLLTYYLSSKVDELEKHFLGNVLNKEIFYCEKILLFHAAFYLNIPQSITQKIDLLFKNLYSKKADINFSEFVLNYVSLIILQKLLNNRIERFDDYLLKILDYTSHHLSSNRRVNTFLITHILDKCFDCNYELGDTSFTNNLIYHCIEDIKHRHGGNDDMFALITFLNIPSEEKINIFEELLKTAKEYKHTWDYDTLTSLKDGKVNIVNPFFLDFLSIQQNILNEFAQLELPSDYKAPGDQLSIFSESSESSKINTIYNFDDIRLKPYLKI